MHGCEEKEERLMLLESWRDFEEEFGSFANKDRVRKLLPEKVKKRRKITAEDGVRVFSCQFCECFFLHRLVITNMMSLVYQSDAGWEEYYDYIFPEDAANQPNLKLLAMAKMWKKQQQQEEDEEEQEEEEEEEEQQVPQGKEAQESSEPEEQEPAAHREQTENDYDDRDDDDESSSSSSSSDSESDGDHKDDKDKTEQTKADEEKQ